MLRAKYERDVLPGELVMVTADGVTSRQYAPPNQTSCIFEHVYFARPDSMIFGRWVQESREEMGRQLARESHVDADLVVPVPDSGVTAAIGYAAESGIPFRFGLIRNHYVGRTFIEPEQRVRDFGVKLKLNPVRNLLEGRRIILIDDSIIRGTTSRKIVRMVRQAGAKEVHLRISCPPTISPCFYGVDTPRKSELIAANNTIEEIRQFIEADSLAYLSLDGMRNACDGGEGNHILRRVLHGRVSDAVGRCRRHSAGRGGCGLGPIPFLLIFFAQPEHPPLLPNTAEGRTFDGSEEEVVRQKVRSKGRQESRKGDAREEERQAEERPQRQKGDEPQTGNRDWIVRGAQSGRKGSEEKILVEEKQYKEIFIEEEVVGASTDTSSGPESSPDSGARFSQSVFSRGVFPVTFHSYPS